MTTRTLAGKLTVLTIMTIALGACFSWFFAARAMREEISEITTKELAADARVFKRVLELHPRAAGGGFPISFEELVRWSELLEVRLTVIGSDGTVLADSSVPYEELGALDNHLDRPEVKGALARGYGTDQRYSETTNIPYLYYAIAADVDGFPDMAVIRCSFSLSRFYVLISRVRANIFGAILLAGAASLLVGIIGVRRVTRPIRELTKASRESRDGKKPSYPSGGSLEIEELARTLKEGDEARAKMVGDLQNERNQLQTVVQSAPCGLMLVDQGGRVNCANGVLAPLLRGAPERIVGADAEAALRSPELISLVTKARWRQYDDVSFIFRRNGAERFYNARVLPAGEREILLVLDDITERRLMEEARKSFVADAGHELRTPLASISVAAELLSEMEDSTAQARAPYIEEIMRQRERMTVLVDDLLFLSKLESGVPSSPSKMFDLSRMAEAQTAEAQKSPRASGVAWETEFPAGVSYFGREEEIRRCVSNLLDNAVKYTHKRYRGEPGGRITVRLKRDDARCVLFVSDNGVGIPGEDVARIFGRFERIERDRARDGCDTGGYGLGLAIVKTAVESHGGEVTVKSEDGVTEFAVSLPLSES